MAKLTKAQQTQIARIIASLEVAQAFLASESVVICRKDRAATTSLHYTRAPVPESLAKDSAPLFPICKDIGCDLALLPTAIASLKTFFMES